MTAQPKQFSYEYASIFQDASVVAAYPHWPPYPAEIFTILAGLIDKTVSTCRLLDAGCGTGQMTAGLLGYVDQIDAVDISAAMIAAGQQMPYGADPKLRWITSGIETALLQPSYALIAAASLHWMPWATTLPRFAHTLSPHGYLALVDNHDLPNPWDEACRPIVTHYAMNRDFQPYTMRTVAAELQQRGLFQLVGVSEAQPIAFQQSIDSWIEGFHASNGFSRDRMGAAQATAFDEAIRTVMLTYCPTGIVERQITGRVIYGKPLDPVG